MVAASALAARLDDQSSSQQTFTVTGSHRVVTVGGHAVVAQGLTNQSEVKPSSISERSDGDTTDMLTVRAQGVDHASTWCRTSRCIVDTRAVL